MSSGPTAGSTAALAWAKEAHTLVQARPRQARALAERALAVASAERAVEAEIAARYALGWAQNVLGDARAARATMAVGIRLAERHGDHNGAGLLRRHVAFALAVAGHNRAARREIDRAIASLSGQERARSQVHRLEIHRRAHVAEPAVHRRVLADAAAALRALHRDGDEIWEARLLYNRGQLFTDRGELGRAEADFHRALGLYQRVGAEVGAADTVLALAEVALLNGDVLECLRTLESVHGTLPHGYLSNLDECRMLALLQARLLPEAQAAAQQYVDLCARAGRDDHATSALLELATVALMSGDPTTARRFAARAGRSFAARGKPVNAALARTVGLRARLLAGDVSRSSLQTGLSAAAVLEHAGWRRESQRTRLLVARIALAVGSNSIARRQLGLAEGLLKRGTVTDRVELCHATALLAVADGQTTAAERMLQRGLRLLDEYRAALGAAELRATASGIGTELAQAGLRMALGSGSPGKVLGWAERLHASALRLPAVRPPRDATLRRLQTDLRRTVRKGVPSQQTRLEDAIRARSRLVEPDGGAEAAIPSPDQASLALADRALLEYFELDDGLHALTLAGGNLSLQEVGAGAADELDWLRFAYARLAAGRMTAEQRAATLANATASAAALDELLIAPLRDALGEAPLVIVPTGALHALPWTALPSLRGRPLVVAPSLALWCDLAARPRSRRRRAAHVAGPRLRHAAREVRELGALRPGATVLHGKAATAEATLRTLDGAAIAHLACHGHFRADSPLFSSLELADGPLNVYELQRLRRAPEIVVLSACDLGLSQTHPGDELLGLAAALLGMGTRTVVASVVPVPDAAARRVMLAFHQHLLAGLTPAAALARAQARARTAGFVCLGTG
jgi:CHAT domain